MIASSAFGAGLFGAMRHGLNSPQGRTMAFGSLAVAQLLHALNYRSSKAGVFERGELTSGSRLVQIIAGSVAAQIAAMLVPGVRSALNVAPLSLLDAGAVIAGGVLPLAIAQTRNSRAYAEPNRLHFRRRDLGSRPETSSPGGDGSNRAAAPPLSTAKARREAARDVQRDAEPHALRLERRRR